MITILLSQYQKSNIAPYSVGNDMVGQFFVSPLMVLLFRHLLDIFLLPYIDNQVKFFNHHVPEYAYYMTNEWLLSRYLFHNLNRYSTDYRGQLYYLPKENVTMGQMYGMMVIEDYKSNCLSNGIDPQCITHKYWLDHQQKSNIASNQDEQLLRPSKRTMIGLYHWLNETSFNLYNGAILNSIAF